MKRYTAMQRFKLVHLLPDDKRWADLHDVASNLIVTGSKVADIFNQGYNTPKKLFEEMSGQTTKKREEKQFTFQQNAMDYGKRQEKFEKKLVRDYLQSKKWKHTAIMTPGIVFYNENLAATSDDLLYYKGKKIINVEYKCSYYAYCNPQLNREEGVKWVPIKYILQCTLQMAAWDNKATLLIINKTPHRYFIYLPFYYPLWELIYNRSMVFINNVKKFKKNETCDQYKRVSKTDPELNKCIEQISKSMINFQDLNSFFTYFESILEK